MKRMKRNFLCKRAVYECIFRIVRILPAQSIREIRRPMDKIRAVTPKPHGLRVIR